jgi:hypothetical protein
MNRTEMKAATATATATATAEVVFQIHISY